MKSKMLILTLLFASLHASPADIDSVYAEYCLNLKYTDEGLSVVLSLVKQHKDLKPILLNNTQEPLMCGNYYFNPTTCGDDYYFNPKPILQEVPLACTTIYFNPIIEFEFIDTYGKEIASITAGESAWQGGGCYGLQPVIQVDIPPSSWDNTFARLTKEELLPFKNKVINAYTNVIYECLPHLDTTYRFDFPVKITGECGCDALNKRKRHR